MGVITLALVAFHVLPGGKQVGILTWVIASCATAMGLGTFSDGWRIIKTLGTKIIDLQPINGFAAETSASASPSGSTRSGGRSPGRWSRPGF